MLAPNENSPALFVASRRVLTRLSRLFGTGWERQVLPASALATFGLTPSRRVGRVSKGVVLARALTLAVLISVIPLAAVGALRMGSRKIAALGALQDSTIPGGVRTDYRQTPLYFELNQGQTDGQVKFLSRGRGYNLFLTPAEAVLTLRRPDTADTTDPSNAPYVPPSRKSTRSRPAPERTVLRISLVGASAAPQVVGEDLLSGKMHYLLGADRQKWRTDVPLYAKVRYKNVYPGTDLVYYGTSQGDLEYDFVVGPRENPHKIAQKFAGAQSVSLDGSGRLVLRLDRGQVAQYMPVAYQIETNGRRRGVSVRHVLKGPNRDQVGFELGTYDRDKPVVIDPVLVYSTYLGGSNGDGVFSISVDSSGNVYLAGWTDSADFPTTLNSYRGGVDAFVTKLDSAGNLVFSTCLGGGNLDWGHSVAVDAAGNVHVVGDTSSGDFPLVNPVQPALSGGKDAFIVRLNPAGNSLLYATFLGGSGDDSAHEVTLDQSGNAYVIGDTKSTNFPLAGAAPLQSLHRGGDGDGFVTKLNAAGTGLVYSTYLGGTGLDYGDSIAVDTAGSAYVTGETSSADLPASAGAYQRTSGGGSDVYVAKLNPSGSGLAYLTYLGGSANDQSLKLVLDSANNAYVTGATNSVNFPTRNAFQPTQGGGGDDAFVTKLSAAGDALVYSTYLGGSGRDGGTGLAVDAQGNAYVGGWLTSADFTVTPNAPQQAPSSGATSPWEAFTTKLSAAGDALVYSTYLGGNGQDYGMALGIDAAANAYMAVQTSSTDLATVNASQPGYQGYWHSYIAKLSADANAPPTVSLTSPVNGAVYTAPATISLSANAGDSDGTVAKVEFFANDVRVGTSASAGSPYTFTWNGAADGVYRITARATDNKGAVTASTEVVTLTVNVAATSVTGRGIGLRGEYFDNPDFTVSKLVRIDPTVNFYWDGGVSPDPSLQDDYFSVRWSGYVEPRYTEAYTFYTTSDDGVRLWVNNQLVIDNWASHPTTENAGVPIALQAGQRYTIQMEMREDWGSAAAKLAWSSPSEAKQIIPQSQLYPAASMGTLLREWWLNIGAGNAVSDLTNHSRFPNDPSGRDEPTRFEGFTNWADNYGTRLRGYVHPPVSGAYTFWIAGDDNCELWLSTDDDPANRTRIARVPGATSPQEWGRYPEQRSATITLQAGTKYFIEALHKEGVGGDNVSVAWQVPGSTAPDLITGAYLSPFVFQSPGNYATFVSQSVPATMTAGQSASVLVTMRNTGTTTWTPTGQYRLGSQNPQDNNRWGLSRVELPRSVAPGQDVTFSLLITAPSTPGTYPFQWRMVQDAVEWFGEYTPNVSVTVTAATPPSGTTATLHLSVDNDYTELYVNGQSYTPGPNHGNFQQADSFSNIANLNCVAVKAVNADPGNWAGLIAKVEFSDSTSAVSDTTWKVYYASNSSPPPADGQGRPWYHSDYDDSGWAAPVSYGAYGVGPWGTQSGLSMMSGAQWIWLTESPYGKGASPVYLRKRFGVGTQPSPPSAPSALSAAAISSIQINLFWTDNSANESGFKIERKTGAGGAWAQIGTVGANVTTYADTSGLTPATTYTYQVRAYNAAGDSAYSNPASATTPGNPSPPPSLLSVGVDPGTVVGGNASNGMVTLSGPAPAGGAVVSLASSNTAIAQVPGSVTIAEGATRAPFTVTTFAVSTTTSVTISGTYRDTTKTAQLTVTPPDGPPPAVGFSLAPEPFSLTIPQDQSDIVLIKIRRTGGFADSVSLNLVGAPSGVTSSFTPQPGVTTSTLTLSVGRNVPTGTYNLTVQGVAGSLSATTLVRLTVTPKDPQWVKPDVYLDSLTVEPNDVLGDSSYTCTGTVTLTGPAPDGGAVVRLLSGHLSGELAYAVVPYTVVVPPGDTSASFAIFTSWSVFNPAASVVVNLSASYNGVTKVAPLTVRRPNAPSAYVDCSQRPTGLTAVASNRQVHLSWDPVPDAIGYEVAGRMDTGSGYDSWGTAGNTYGGSPTDTSLVVTGLSSGRIVDNYATYQFRVRAYKRFELSLYYSVECWTEYSDVVTITPLPGAARPKIMQGNEAMFDRTGGGTPIRFQAPSNGFGSQPAHWDILDPSGRVIAHWSQSSDGYSGPEPNGWGVNFFDARRVPNYPGYLPPGSDRVGRFVVKAPCDALVGEGYTVRAEDFYPQDYLGMDPTNPEPWFNGSAQFDVVPFGTADQPPVPQGGCEIVGIDDIEQRAGTGAQWVIARCGEVIATNTSPNGWWVTTRGRGWDGSVVVCAPLGATLGRNYLVAFHNESSYLEYTGYFSVVPGPGTPLPPPTRGSNGLVISDTPAPGWAQSLVAADASGAGGAGPSSANRVLLASGVLENDPGPDIVASNPQGPDIAYTRLYRTVEAGIDYASPGLSPGWVDNYDITIYDPNRNGTYGPLTLTYPNGAKETLTPLLDATGKPTGRFQTPPGAPYRATGVAKYALISDKHSSWSSITITFKDKSSWTFGSNYRLADTYLLNSVRDEFGNANSITYNYSGQIRKIQGGTSGGYWLEFAYDGDGHLASVTDNYGRKVRYAFTDQVGQKCLTRVSQISSNAAQWQYTYRDIAGEPFLDHVAVPDPAGTLPMRSHPPIDYDTATGKVRSLTDANGNHRAYTYQSDSTKVTVKDGNGQVVEEWTQKLAPASNGVTTLVAAAGVRDTRGESSVLYNGLLPQEITNPEGQKSVLEYDGQANVKTASSSRGVVLENDYDYPADFPQGLVRSVRTRSGAEINGEARFYYGTDPSRPDTYGRLTKVETPRPGSLPGTSEWVKTEFTYAAYGNVATVTVPAPQVNPDGSPIYVTYTYNYLRDGTYTGSGGLGQPLTVTDPENRVTHFRYDPRGNLTTVIDPAGIMTTFTYNVENQLTSVLNPATGQSGPGRGRTVYKYRYPGGPLDTMTQYDEAGAPVRTISYGYGAEGEGTKQTVGGTPQVQIQYDGQYRVKVLADGKNNPTTHYFDPVGNLSEMAYPGTDTTRWTQYDRLGNVKQRVDGENLTTNYLRAEGPNEDNRLVGVQYVGQTGQNVTLDHDAYSRVRTVKNGAAETAYTYDVLDNVLTATTRFIGMTGDQEIEYTYYPDGSRRTMSTPAGDFFYEYDKTGLPTRLMGPHGETRWKYLSNGWLDTQTTATNGAPSAPVVTTYTYDALGRVIRTVNAASSTVVSRFGDMTYDGAGNRTTLTSSLLGAPEFSGQTTYAYDSKDQLKRESSTRPVTPGGTGYTDLFDYDDAGNPTLFAGATRGYNPNNQLNGSTYDRNGNPRSYRGMSLTFDAENRMTSAMGTLPSQYGYYADGRRAWKEVSGSLRTYFLYDGDVPVVELNPYGGVAAVNTFGATGLIARGDGTTATTYYLFDPQGSVAQRLDNRGNVLTSHLFSAYGTGVHSAGVAEPWGYKAQHGYYTDNETRLILCTFRYYDPQGGRWLTRDPIGYEGGINLYAYCENNPVTRADPDGLTPPDALTLHLSLEKEARAQERAAKWRKFLWFLNWGLENVPLGGGGGGAAVGTVRTVGAAKSVGLLGKLSKLGLPNKGTAAYTQLLAKLVRARNAKINTGIGTATRAEADFLGKRWVGGGYREIRVKDQLWGYESKDGTRMYRLPQSKQSEYATTGVQANFMHRPAGTKAWKNNAHLNITD